MLCEIKVNSQYSRSYKISIHICQWSKKNIHNPQQQQKKEKKNPPYLTGKFSLIYF